MKKTIFFLTILFIFLFSSTVLAGEIEGEILAVNADENLILFKSNNKEVQEYQVALNAKIHLNQKEAYLGALRPITSDSFQFAKVNVDKNGVITKISSFYQIVKVKVVKVSKEKIRFKYLDNKGEINFSKNKDVEVIRNNFSANLNDLKVGDEGSAILGVEGKLARLVVYHYEISGLLKEVDQVNDRIIINVGSRLKPILKTYSVDEGTEVVSGKEQIRIEDLINYNWVKLEVDNSINRIVVKKI